MFLYIFHFFSYVIYLPLFSTAIKNSCYDNYNGDANGNTMAQFKWQICTGLQEKCVEKLFFVILMV